MYRLPCNPLRSNACRISGTRDAFAPREYVPGLSNRFAGCYAAWLKAVQPIANLVKQLVFVLAPLRGKSLAVGRKRTISTGFPGRVIRNPATCYSNNRLGTQLFESRMPFILMKVASRVFNLIKRLRNYLPPSYPLIPRTVANGAHTIIIN